MAIGLGGLSLLISALYAGGKGLELFEKRGERGVQREQLAAQLKMGETAAMVQKRLTEEARAQSKDYTKLLLQTRKEEQAMSREQMMMQAFMQAQAQKTAALMQAIQAMSGRGGSTLDVLRSRM